MGLERETGLEPATFCLDVQSSPISGSNLPKHTAPFEEVSLRVHVTNWITQWSCRCFPTGNE
jgi:hypothetical protein